MKIIKTFLPGPSFAFEKTLSQENQRLPPRVPSQERGTEELRDIDALSISPASFPLGCSLS